MTVSLKYNGGIYLRLSKDDDCGSESSSISTQRSILCEYARSHDIIIVREYVDDGFSGTDFNRPAFKRMIRDIESGEINCVLTKDLSRLGRNSAKTSELLDEYFPKNNIRYIAVIEGYDNVNLNSGCAIAAPFMLLMNEMYARDISGKIRSSFRSKMENGEFIGSFAPYGYKKDTVHGNKNHLVPDCRTEHIVREIFRMAENGSTPKEISQYMNARNIAPPLLYRRLGQPYLPYGISDSIAGWTSSSICKMLKNKVYIGCTQQGKTAKISFKSKETVAKKESEWISVPNTHEPLVTEETFDIVRKRTVSRRCSPSGSFKNSFSGIAKCADCGRNMTTSLNGGASYNLSCGGYKCRGAAKCSNHFIGYALLQEVVLREIRFFLSFDSITKKKILEELQNACKNAEETGRIAAEIRSISERMARVAALSKKAYEDYSAGLLSEMMFKNLSHEYEIEYTYLKTETAKAEARANTGASDKTVYKRLLENVTAAEKLTLLLAKKLIERIDIEQGYFEQDEKGKTIRQQRIRIYYRFADEA